MGEIFMANTSSKLAGAVVTPTKRAAAPSRTKSNENQKTAENFDPNVCIPRAKIQYPPPKVNSGNNANNPSSRKSNIKRLASDSPCAKKKIRERKFVIAKKKSRLEELGCNKCEKAARKSKCSCVAYDSLRASHEEFLNNPDRAPDEVDLELESEYELVEIGDEGVKERSDGDHDELRLKRSREKLMEEARQSVPEQGSGRVMHLVKAFEKLLMIPKSDKYKVGDEKKTTKWALPGLQQPMQIPSITTESLGLSSRPSFSSDCRQRSLSSRTSSGGRKSRPSSSESSITFSRRQLKMKQSKAISRKPFKLTTEQRGRDKDEEFTKKLQKKLGEEEKLRIHVAQGLPSTTAEPEILVKPPVKESTKPLDFALHTDTRAVERAEFDSQVAKKMKLIEQYRMEMERQQRLAEEEEIRRLRKELVPKAQPMPFFDRPFIPKRSVKNLTIPKEPKFHLLQKHKKMKCYMSLDGLPTQLSE